MVVAFFLLVAVLDYRNGEPGEAVILLILVVLVVGGAGSLYKGTVARTREMIIAEVTATKKAAMVEFVQTQEESPAPTMDGH